MSYVNIIFIVTFKKFSFFQDCNYFENTGKNLLGLIFLINYHHCLITHSQNMNTRNLEDSAAVLRILFTIYTEHILILFQCKSTLLRLDYFRCNDLLSIFLSKIRFCTNLFDILQFLEFHKLLRIICHSHFLSQKSTFQ